MMGNLQENSIVQKSLLDESFRLKTQLQIVKDFSLVNLEFPNEFLTEPFLLNDTECLVANNVAVLMEKGESQLLQLLYIVDLPEIIFLELTRNTDFLSKIAEKIVYREAYKIWLRTNYSEL